MLHIRIAFMLFALNLLAPASLIAAEITAFPDPRSSEVERQFAFFSQNWIDKVDRNLASRIGKIDFFIRDNGFVGRYMQVDRATVSWSVKQVAHAPRSYIGLLEYMEWTYESAAPTREDAARGPFVQVSGRKITEIFQYLSNRWVE